jgi:uncharacterized RDD family membrane protein YckC
MAMFVDVLVCLVPFGALMMAGSQGGETYLAMRFVAAGMSHGYFIVCTALWGQTLGKRAAGIQVRSVDGGGVTLGQSLVRDLVPLAGALLGIFGALIAYGSLPPEVAAQSGPAVKDAIRAGLPGWASSADIITSVFEVADVIVFFSTMRFRALHDLMAGTVVVHTD